MLGKATRDESGKILILVLVLLVVGGLLLTPLLGLMSTGLMAGQVYEKKASELYAADAGVEDAMWQIKQPTQDPTRVPSAPGDEQSYQLASAINTKDVDDITIGFIRGTLGNAIYSVTSRAIGLDGSATTIGAYVRTLPRFWTNAITSTGKVTLQSGSEVHGDVMGELPEKDWDKVDGTVRGPYPLSEWPCYEALRGFYWSENLPALPVETCGGKTRLRVEVNYPDFPYGFHEGNVEIENKGGGVLEAKLTGTVYISDILNEDGDIIRPATLAMTQGTDDWILDLNNQTIYVEGGTYNVSKTNKYALDICDSVRIKGSGAIIAEGNIKFQPKVETGNDNHFIFVMSVLGVVDFWPSGAFYGSVAGREVHLGPNTAIHYTDPQLADDNGTGMVFPFDAVEWAVRILTYRIS